MKNRYILMILICFYIPYSLADSVIKSGGIVSELMTIGYNKALDEARDYYEKRQLEYNAQLVKTTLEMISVELTSYLKRANYLAFEREDKLTYFNLFLNKNLITMNEINFESEFKEKENEKDEEEKEIEIDCHYQFYWDIKKSKNPQGKITSYCQNIVKSIPIKYRTGIGNDSIYGFYDDKTKQQYTSDTVDGIINYILMTQKDNYYLDLMEGVMSRYNNYEIQEYTTETNKEDFEVGHYILNDKKVALSSGAHFASYFLLKYVGIKPDGTRVQESTGGAGSYGDIDINLPLAPENSEIRKEDKAINPFNELPVKGRFLTGLSKNNIDVSRLTHLLNSAWRAASTRKGYNGIPYRAEYQITNAMLINYLNDNNRNLTQLDLYDVIPNGRITLFRWSDKFNAYLSGEEIIDGEKIPLDVGDYPNLQQPDLTPPSTFDMLFPITNSFNFLKEIQLDNHQSYCPAITIPFLGETISDNTYCQVIDEQRELIRLFFVISWTLSGLYILFRSN